MEKCKECKLRFKCYTTVPPPLLVHKNLKIAYTCRDCIHGKALHSIPYRSVFYCSLTDSLTTKYGYCDELVPRPKVIRSRERSVNLYIKRVLSKKRGKLPRYCIID